MPCAAAAGERKATETPTLEPPGPLLASQVYGGIDTDRLAAIR
jgi:hypothetical protein